MVRKGIKKWKLSHRKRKVVWSRLDDMRDIRLAVSRLKKLEMGLSYTIDAKTLWKELGLDE